MGTNNPINKRGALFFTVDTMVAGIIFTLTVVVVLSFFLSEPIIQDTSQILNNYVDYVSETKMVKFKNVYRNVYNFTREEDENLFIHQEIAKLVFENNNSEATKIITAITNVSSLVPSQFGIQYTVNGTLLYIRPTTNPEFTNTNLSYTMFSYFEENNTVRGPYITKISVWS